MFYVCVVCMVGVKGSPLIKLTGARCKLWELMISPRINMSKIKKCLLLVCQECNQLLFTMLEFRKTMHLGAKNLLFLYKNLRSKNEVRPLEQVPEQEQTRSQDLPAVIGAQSDEWLPVANEEVVQSDTWTDVNAPPVDSKTKHVKLPPALPPRIINQGAVHVSEYNEDYAVLTPINEDNDLQCKEDVVYSSELSESSKIDELVQNIQAEFSSVSDSSKLNKIRLNRQLFEAMRVTLKSPLTEEFDIKYEPESESESGCKSGPELAREWALELARELELDSERKLELGTERKPECESALESERESESKSARESALDLERKLVLETECKPERESVFESERKLERESESKAARELEPDSESTLSCDSDYEDPEHFPNIIFAKAFNGLADDEPQMQEKDSERGEGSVEHIHCHLVTNPPSEWPCTGEQCWQQSVDEGEAASTPSDSPRDTPTVGSKTTKEVVPGRPKCKLCARSFAKISMLWHHFERAHMDASLKCNVCRKEFRNETELTFHKMKHQFKKTVEYQFEAPSRHACLECAVRCSGPRGLRAHLGTRTHAAKMQWRFQCDICKRKCADKKRLADHIQREHLAKEAVKCSMCSATFRSARTLRRHVAKHIVESKTQKNKPTDTQTNGQARKRARDTHTKGRVNTDTLTNVEDAQTAGQRKRPYIRKTSTAGLPPKSATMIGPADQSTKRPRKTTNNEMYAYTDTRRNTPANIKEQDDMVVQTNGQIGKKPRKVTHKVNACSKGQGKTPANPYMNLQDDMTEIESKGQTSKLPRKVTHKKVNKYATNELIDTYRNEQDDIGTQTNKPTRKTNKKANNYANRQAKTHTDTYISDQDDKEKQTDGQTRKKPRKTTNSPANTLTNKQVTHAYVNGQANTHKETHSQALKNSKIHANGRNTHTDIQETADTTHTHTNRGVRKRRKRAYVASKRARMPAKAAAKTSLFDMLSSFIL